MQIGKVGNGADVQPLKRIMVYWDGRYEYPLVTDLSRDKGHVKSSH